MNTPLAPEENLASLIGRIAGKIGSDGFSTGHRASLRRMSPGQAPPLSFYRFAFNYLPQHWEYAADDWITITAGIAIMSPNAHNISMGLGRVLGAEGYSEARLERLLLSEGDVRRVLFLRAIRFLAAKSKPFNWLDGARFLLVRDADKKEALNLNIARDFYRQEGVS